jgi:hypothetical protein
MGDDRSRKAGNKEQKARERRNVSAQKVTLSAGIGVTGIGEIGVRYRLLFPMRIHGQKARPQHAVLVPDAVFPKLTLELLDAESAATAPKSQGFCFLLRKSK